jgi:hypothetical protein
MSSKAQRRSRKRNRKISLPGGEAATAPKLQGSREPQEDPRKVVIDARVRVFGIKADDATAALHGSQAGCCIAAAQGDRVAMWQAWQDINAARRNYRLRNGIQDGPKCATIAMIPDAMQTDTSLTVDLRTAEERDAAANRAWQSWHSRIKALPAPQMIRAVLEAMDGGINGQGGELWADGKPTTRGVVFVTSLRVLTNG